MNFFTDYKIIDSASLQINQRYHTEAVCNSTAQTVKICINGIETASTVISAIPSSIGNDPGRFQAGVENSAATAANFHVLWGD